MKKLTVEPGSVEGAIYVKYGERVLAEFFGYAAEEHARVFIKALRAHWMKG